MGRVTCMYGNGDGCQAWVLDKETMKSGAETNRAIVQTLRDEAGEWIIPFAVGVCVKSFYTNEAACRAAVGF